MVSLDSEVTQSEQLFFRTTLNMELLVWTESGAKRKNSWAFLCLVIFHYSAHCVYLAHVDAWLIYWLSHVYVSLDLQLAYCHGCVLAC